MKTETVVYKCDACGSVVGKAQDLDEDYSRRGWFVLQRLVGMGYVSGYIRQDFCCLKCLRLGVAAIEEGGEAFNET